MKKLLTKRNIIIFIVIIMVLSLFSNEEKITSNPTNGKLDYTKSEIIQNETTQDQPVQDEIVEDEVIPVNKEVSICDGTNITENCELDGIQYATYKYYPEVKEVSHFETKTTYTEEVTGYCTLCNDGTRSPSCSTGKGTCSHHGGVAEWNAPIYSKVAHTEQIKIVDSPAIEERIEKIIKTQ